MTTQQLTDLVTRLTTKYNAEFEKVGIAIPGGDIETMIQTYHDSHLSPSDELSQAQVDAILDLVMNVPLELTVPSPVAQDEHVAVGSVITTATAAGGAAPYTYSISGTTFGIDASTGVITNIVDIEYDDGSSYSPTVTVTDNAGDTDTAIVTIIIGEVTETVVIDSATTYASLTAQAVSHNLVEADFSNTTNYGVFCGNSACNDWCESSIIIDIPAGATSITVETSGVYTGGIGSVSILGVGSDYMYIDFTDDSSSDSQGHSYIVDDTTIFGASQTDLSHDVRTVGLQAGDTQISIIFAGYDNNPISSRGFNSIVFN